MADPQSPWKLLTNPTSLIAGSLVIAGLLLASVSWWFLLLTGVGTFGPGVLRELGWLRDKDEFQLQAAHRAGYYAFLVVGLVAIGMVAYFRAQKPEIKDPTELATFFFVLLWCTWFFSSLLDYWGAKITAARVLVAFGIGWLVFTILSNIGSEWTGWAALLLHPLLTVPFFAMAWLSKRWPRITGMLLLAFCVFFTQFFGFFSNDHLPEITRAITFLLFVGPLLASGIALLCVRPNGEGSKDAAGTMAPNASP